MARRASLPTCAPRACAAPASAWRACCARRASSAATPAARAHHGRRPGPHARAEAGGARLHGPGARSPLAGRQHVPADGGGLALPGRPAGRPRAPGGRLGAWPTTCAPHSPSTPSRWPSGRAARRRAWCTTPTAGASTPRRPTGRPRRPRPRLRDEPRRATASTTPWPNAASPRCKAELVDARTLADPRRGAHGHLRVARGLVQPPAPPLRPRLPAPATFEEDVLLLSSLAA